MFKKNEVQLYDPLKLLYAFTEKKHIFLILGRKYQDLGKIFHITNIFH